MFNDYYSNAKLNIVEPESKNGSDIAFAKSEYPTILLPTECLALIYKLILI